MMIVMDKFLEWLNEIIEVNFERIEFYFHNQDIDNYHKELIKNHTILVILEKYIQIKQSIG